MVQAQILARAAARMEWTLPLATQGQHLGKALKFLRLELGQVVLQIMQTQSTDRQVLAR